MDIARCILNCLVFIQRFLKIRDKDGHLIPFLLNKPQLRLYAVIKEQWKAGKPVRIIILKARQMGFSTLVEGIIFWLAVTAFNVECMIVAHTDEATRKLFQMSRRFYEYLPAQLKPMQKASNANELIFDKPAKYRGKTPGLGSHIRVATAGGTGIGRGSTLRALHLSEFAWWPGDKRATLTGLMQAVPDRPGTLVVIESTAKGYDEFKKLWDEAVENEKQGIEGFIPVFFAWFEMDEYRRAVPPGFQRTQEEEALSGTFGLDDEQLAWRRWCIANNCGGDVNLFRQEYPATPDEAFIATGQCVFDKQALVMRRAQVREQEWETGVFRYTEDIGGRIDTWEWVPDEKGPIRIRVHPQKDVPYVIGGDTAGTGSDWFVGQVLDNRTGEQVAVLHHQFGERMYARQMFCLGMYYNSALIGIETNYSTYPQIVLEEMGYPNFYTRERMDTYTGQMQQAFGFRTTPQSRPVIIDGLKDVAKYALQNITDYATLGEMLTFVYDENWRPQAEKGEHDDLVMALAIAHHIRAQQTTAVKPKRGKRGKWTEEMYADYRKASPTEREVLRKVWGNPD